MKQEKTKILLIPYHTPIAHDLIKSWMELNYDVYVQFGLIGKWNDFAGIPKGAKIKVPESKPAVIFVESGRDAIFAMKMKRREGWSGVPIVILYYWFPDWRMAPIYYMNKCISCCEYVRRYAKKKLFMDTPVVYLPVDTELYKPDFKKREKMALIIGNNFKDRGHPMGYEYMQEIFRKVHEADPSIKLVLLGKNDQKDYPKYVKCLFLEREEIPKYFNKASCVFFTTTFNLLMHSMANAMSSGANVVAFDINPFDEVIQNGKSGWRIPQFDVDAFANKVVEVSNKPSNKMGMNARAVMMDKCERIKVVKRLMKLSGV